MKHWMCVGLLLLGVVGVQGRVQAKQDAAGCQVKMSGGLEQAFACSAELNKLKYWTFVVSGDSELPYDFGGMISLSGDPVVGKVYAIADVESVSLMLRDKHDELSNSWSASASKSLPTFGPKRLPPTIGSMQLKITAIGPDSAVHGTLTATLKAQKMNQNKKDVVLSFSF